MLRISLNKIRFDGIPLCRYDTNWLAPQAFSSAKNRENPPNQEAERDAPPHLKLLGIFITKDNTVLNYYD